MNKSLGRGLEALIQNKNTEESSNYLLGKISIEKIRPNSSQPRNYFDQKKMDELINSIKQRGILQPITVRELKNGKVEILWNNQLKEVIGNEFVEKIELDQFGSLKVDGVFIAIGHKPNTDIFENQLDMKNFK